MDCNPIAMVDPWGASTTEEGGGSEAGSSSSSEGSSGGGKTKGRFKDYFPFSEPTTLPDDNNSSSGSGLGDAISDIVEEAYSQLEVINQELKEDLSSLVSDTYDYSKDWYNSSDLKKFMDRMEYLTNVEWTSSNWSGQGPAIKINGRTNRVNVDDVAFTKPNGGATNAAKLWKFGKTVSDILDNSQSVAQWMKNTLGTISYSKGPIDAVSSIFSKNSADANKVDVIVISSIVKGNALKPTEVDRITTSPDSAGIVADSLRNVNYGGRVQYIGVEK
jgi:hypothetical protein